METTNNVTLADVNANCDLEMIRKFIRLRLRIFGSITSADSYLIQRLKTGTYVLDIGRYHSLKRQRLLVEVRTVSIVSTYDEIASYG
ncbi:hypothetical protein PsorP6_016935 [Peronosclerospora sorghi]|uniref:Uncharacterized protein n=1 Tax=Peronosclerospora sorghi TaxID=230839 RepID=A0ACC0WEC2_9STRA|nr:hypothetical protein PsorP6_016935 [Peronosclerospora sorghi]